MRTQSFLLPAGILALGLSLSVPAMAQRRDGGEHRGHGRGGEYRGEHRGPGPRGGDWRGGERWRGDGGRRGYGYGYGPPVLGGALLGLGLGAVLGGALAPPPVYAPPPGIYYPPGKPGFYEAPPPAYYGY